MYVGKRKIQKLLIVTTVNNENKNDRILVELIRTFFFFLIFHFQSYNVILGAEISLVFTMSTNARAVAGGLLVLLFWQW